MNEFQRTLETNLMKLVSGKGLYLVDRLVHQSTETGEIFISARIAGTFIEVWIYDEEAQFGGGEIDCRFESPDYDTPEELISAFLASLENYLPEAEDIDPVKLPVVVNENLQNDIPGNLWFFELLSDAGIDMETDDIETGEEFFIALDAEGRLLRFETEEEIVRISAAEATPTHASMLRKLLCASLVEYCSVDKTWCDEASLEELVERGAEEFPSPITEQRQKKAKHREPALLDRIFDFFGRSK